MNKIFILPMIIKAAILVLGILVKRGCQWAYVPFLVLAILAILIDVSAILVGYVETTNTKFRKEK